MGINESNVLYPELSYRIVGLAMEVHNKLGYGFLEKVYENALMILFRREKIHAEQQMGIKVHFEDIVVGTYTADIVVDGKIIVELKAQPRLTQDHRAQTLNYLKATGLRLAIILNFGRHALESERLVM